MQNVPTNENANRKAFPKLEKEAFVFAALFHDLANGPFGHSYEYIVEKQGFIPEKGLADVLLGRQSGSHGKVAKYEPFFLGESNEIAPLEAIIINTPQHNEQLIILPTCKAVNFVFFDIPFVPTYKGGREE